MEKREIMEQLRGLYVKQMQHPKPLRLDTLLHCGGEPLWIEDSEGETGWVLTCDIRDLFDDGRTKKNYGERWKAYLNKPNWREKRWMYRK